MPFVMEYLHPPEAQYGDLSGWPTVNARGFPPLEHFNQLTYGLGRHDPEHTPKRLVLEDPFKPMDVFRTTDGVWIVSQAFMALVEGLDADLHQYFPIEVINHPRVPLEGDWFLFNVYVSADSIDIEDTHCSVQAVGDDPQGHVSLPPRPKQLTLKRGRIPEANLW